MTDAPKRPGGAHSLWRLLLLLLAGVFLGFSAQAVTINVVDPSGAAVTDYRWLVEEDATKASIPGRPPAPATCR